MAAIPVIITEKLKMEAMRTVWDRYKKMHILSKKDVVIYTIIKNYAEGGKLNYLKHTYEITSLEEFIELLQRVIKEDDSE